MPFGHRKAEVRKVMKMLKSIIAGVVVMSIAAVDLTACVPNRKEQEAQAVQMLNEKYHEEFEIEKYLGQESMSDYYEVLAFSTEHPDILFEAKAAVDGSFITDEYVSSRVCRAAEEQIERNLGGLTGYLQVKVQAVSKSIDSVQADMSMQDFMSIKTKNRFAVYLIYYPAEKNIAQAYQALANTFAGLECMSGNLKLYITNEKVLKQVQAYLTETAKVDYEFDEVLEHTEPVTLPFENGVIQVSETQFREMAGDYL